MTFRAELGIAAGAVVALYSGNMGAKQGLELLAEVAGLCAAATEQAPTNGFTHASVTFVFCGNGAGRADLVQRCAGLRNVHFLDLQPIERLNELLAMADIHLLPQRADAADLVMPSKLTGMLASGRSVVATAAPGTELAGVIAGGAEGTKLRAAFAMAAGGHGPLAGDMRGRFGLVVRPGDATAFAAALQSLADQPDLRYQLGRAGRMYAETYLDRNAVLGKFLARLCLPTKERLNAGFISLQLAHYLMVFLLMALFVGTQMPGAWRTGIEQTVHAPSGLSSFAHFAIFAAMALLQTVRPMCWSVSRVVLTVLLLALLSEGLQFLAIDRQPRWTDVGIDLLGALVGLSLGKNLYLLSPKRE